MSGNAPTKEETLRLALQKAQQGNRKVRNQIVSDNVGLIYMVLKRFAGRGYEMEDLFQIGAIGLMKAVDRFDLSREFAFSTYAVPMIIGEIQRFLRDDGMIHLSRHLKDNARKIAIVREKEKKLNNEEPTLEKLAEVTGLTREEILEALEGTREVESIYRKVGEESDRGGKALTLADQLVDERCSEARLVDEIALRQILEKLPERERRLVILRYMEGKTQTEVAGILGMNQVAVSRLEKKILLYLRREFGYNGERGDENKTGKDVPT